MYDVFAPSSTPSTGRVIDDLILRKSYHTFTANVTSAYFHVDEDEECHVDPPAEWVEQQAALRNPTSVLWRLRKQLYGRRRAGTRWVDFMALVQTNLSQKIRFNIGTVYVGMKYAYFKRE